jgi:predicted dehydrogenase
VRSEQHALVRGAELAGIPPDRAHSEVDALLGREDVDAVAVVVAAEDQPAIVLRALDAGKHVLCEVPLSYSFEDCWKLVVAAERSGLTEGMAEQLSHSALVTEWRRLVADGQLGQPLYAEAQYIHGLGEGQYWADPEMGEYLTWTEAAMHPGPVRTRLWNKHHPAWYNPHSLTLVLRISTHMYLASPAWRRGDRASTSPRSLSPF